MVGASLLAAMCLACVAANSFAPGKESPSPLMSRLCRDQMCNDMKFPLIDYDKDTGKCYCAAHPCWNDNGKVHQCSEEPGAPHLVFWYTKQGKLQCGCNAEAEYVSKYIAQEKCPGEHCTLETPMLDYDADNGKCFCRTHPCASLDGFAHGCSDPHFPILHYREHEKDGEVKKVCQCKRIMHSPKEEL